MKNRANLGAKESLSTLPPTPSSEIWIACLCAEWCGLCRDYKAVMQTLASRYPGLNFVWLDIEDQADHLSTILGDTEIETFPTLLIAASNGLHFWGVLQPQPEHLARLLEAAMLGKLPAVQSEQVDAARWLQILSAHPAWRINA